MDEICYLDLQTLIAYLQGKSASLSTTIKVPGMRKPCEGSVVLTSGKVVNSFIQTLDGRRLYEGDHAYALLCTSEEWHIHMEREPTVTIETDPRNPPSSRSVTGILPPVFPSPSPNAPRQRQALDASLLGNLGTKERLMVRMVFTLINGERTVAHLKAQLRLPAETVDEILEYLYRMGLIE